MVRFKGNPKYKPIRGRMGIRYHLRSKKVKKIRLAEWEKVSEFKYLVRYKNKRKGTILEIVAVGFKKPRWKVQKVKRIGGIPKVIRENIKTKSKAINFAKDWMRKHPRG